MGHDIFVLLYEAFVFILLYFWLNLVCVFSGFTNESWLVPISVFLHCAHRRHISDVHLNTSLTTSCSVRSRKISHEYLF